MFAEGGDDSTLPEGGEEGGFWASTSASKKKKAAFHRVVLDFSCDARWGRGIVIEDSTGPLKVPGCFRSVWIGLLADVSPLL